jgi:hypothetical protein
MLARWNAWAARHPIPAWLVGFVWGSCFGYWLASW